MISEFAFTAFWVFVIGCCFGSFLNVCIWRMPRGESVVTAPSHCTKCGHLIAWYDNIPLASYLILRGRCRRCHEHFTSRYFWVELVVGLLFLAYFLRFPQAAGMICAGTAILLCVGTVFTDIEHRIIPDAMTYSAMALGVIGNCTVFFARFPVAEFFASGTRSIPVRVWELFLGSGLLAGLAAAVVLSAFALFGRAVFRREALGWGDVKFLTAVAVLLGAGGAFFTMLSGSLAGMAYGIGAALVRKRKLSRMAIPFGPFLSGAALLWLYFGNELFFAYCRIVAKIIK